MTERREPTRQKATDPADRPSDTASGPVSVVIPAYNEAEGVGPVLRELDETLQAAGIRAEILLVDDGSTDGTAEAARKASPRVRVLRHDTNLGYGAALKTGFRHATHDLVAILDADGTYKAADLVRLLQEMGDRDMVVGARVGPGARIPLLRRPAKWVLRKLANYLARRPIPDLNSGLRVFRKAPLLEHLRLLPDGFSLTTTITLALLVGGYDVAFLPIQYERRTGRSKIRPIRDTLNFLTLILRTIVYFDPLRVFLPLALLLVLVGLLTGLLSWLFLPKILDTTTALLVLSGLQVAVLGLLADLVVRRSGS